MANVLFILTSHDKLGDTGNPTGFYIDEMAAPYWALTDAGHDITIASVKGGKPPIDPNSLDDDPAKRPAPVTRFLDDATASAKLENTPAVATLDVADYDAVFLPGGHGTMWDFAKNDDIARLVSGIYAKDGVVGAVCHGPAGLLGATKPDGTPLVAGLRVNGFTDSEENTVGLTDQVPYLLESRLRELGGKFEGKDDWAAFAVTDGRLVTGQNPQSAEKVGEQLVAALA
ncbi:type 1 glutamine amidotransferase domain-containing protein [Jannaschia helgolandensis]|jgi:putative intracellular protease/amidase|uniref:Putative intracellular protease/amidase n=1 Tax=Jannaschia helgolandensis TaxID=188906 RepID=A0A1H7GAB7_9RHOB|nr:type 1 glutamine amidotransferase domain-containing protein [Jannaschia helgolandensis]SEK33440.1 Putative intracellular protease/amidase [Jannaschia helgolandensis]|tara:strand:+ start:1670 stop:2356 length:687 start_codon:yes stop_codon:yes gene_type:complete